MDVGAAQILGADDLADGGLHQRRAGEEDRALLAHDHGLVAHRRHIGAARRARAHDHGDLRDALRRHVGLVVEDAAEMVLVGEDLGPLRQVGAAGIDQIEARQTVLHRHFLGPEMLLHRHRIIGAALHRGVVADDHAFDAAHPADAGDHARRPAPRCRTCRARPAATVRGTASRDRAARAPARAAGACRARRGACATPRRRPAAPARCGGAGHRPGRAWPGCCA